MKIYVVYKIDRDYNILSFEKAFKTYDKASNYATEEMKSMPLNRALNVKEVEVE